jgi:hypothetical protein
LTVVLYEFETWSLKLREERRRRVIENWALRGIFGPRRDEERGEWRIVHGKGFIYLYSSPHHLSLGRSNRP